MPATPQEPGVVLSKKAAEQIAKTVREVTRRMMNEQPHRARWQHHKGGGRIRHGIVTASHGCGWYTIEKAEWTGARDTYAECDPFGTVVGEGTDACGITLVLPPSQLTGLDEFVEAYDSGSIVVPLIVGTDCLITNLGDTDGETGEPVWQVVQGQINLIVRYREEWNCCEPGGPETMISRTPDILLGLGGPTIQCGECPY